MKKAGLIFALAFLVKFANSQDISGNVRDNVNGAAIENATVKARENKDGAQEKTTTTDAIGYYELYDIITAISTNPLADDILKLNYNGNQIEATLQSKIDPKFGTIANILGQRLAEGKFERTGNFNEYKALLNVDDWATGVMIFADQAGHSTKIVSNNLPYQGTQVYDFKEKSANVGTEEIIIQTDDDPQIDAYQPRTDTVEVNKGDVVDINLEPWPEHTVDFYFDIEDRNGNNLESATINVKELENEDLRFTRRSDANGEATISNIPVGYEEGNKLNPKITNWARNVTLNGFQTFNDTLWGVTTGEEYQLIKLTEEGAKQFFANLYTTTTKENDDSAVEGALAKLWEIGTTDTLKVTTNSQGEADFLNVEISSSDGENPDNVNYGYSLSKTGLEDLVTSFTLTEGDFNKSFQMVEEQTVPTDKQYTIILNSEDMQGNDVQNMDWEIRNSNNEIIDYGNTGSNAIDTAMFVNTNASLNIIINTGADEYKDATKTQTVNAGQTSITTMNELMTYLYEWKVFAKDSETGNLLDSVEVKAYQNNNIIAQSNGGSNTEVNLSTTQPGHTIDLTQLIQRNGYETPSMDNITVTEGQANEFTYNLVKRTVTPDTYNYTVTIVSKDKDGNLNPNSDWSFTDVSSNKTWTGNTGANSTSILEYTDTDENSDVELTVSKTEYENDFIATNIASGQNITLTSDNAIIKYLYEAQVGARNAQTGTDIDSVNVRMLFNGQQIDEDNSLEGLTAYLEMTQPGHSQNVSFIVDRNQFESDTISATLNEGQTNNFVYDLTPITQVPVEKQYTIAISSNTPNVAWTISGDEGTWNGNTGENSLDTLEFMSIDASEVLNFLAEKTEYTDYQTQVTALAEQITNINSVQERLKYLYEAQVGATDSESGTTLDSLDVQLLFNGQVVDSDQSLSSTVANLEMQAIDHTQDVEIIAGRNGYESDTISATLNEGEANNITFQLVKEQSEPQEAVAYLWRAPFDPNQSGAISDIEIINEELNYHDIRTGVSHDVAWKDTIPVNATGTTEVKIIYTPRPGTGSQDLYPLEKIITLSPDGTSQGYDYLEAIRQEKRIKLNIVDAITGNNVNGYTIDVKDNNGNVIQTITSNDGNALTKMLPVGFQGSIDAYKDGDNQHFKHDGIPIVKESNPLNYPPSSGRILFEEDGVDRFADTLQVYDIRLVPTVTQDPKTGENKTVDITRLKTMDGNNSNYLPTLRDGIINVHFADGTTTEQKQWAQGMFDLINDDFGIPFVLNEVASALPENGITVTSMDNLYLNSIKGMTGMNMEVSDLSGLTSIQGTDNIDDINVHTSSNIRLREGTTIMNGDEYSYSTISGLREIMYRTFHTTQYDGAVSVSNITTPNTMTEVDMSGDRTYYRLIYELRKGRSESISNGKGSSGTYTIELNN
ncbi:carboxypeptidase-like regulatory domain-containing protein [uncultured Draconibacterium sp.]|uniref:carboxypeptidase-like regulatory domain-containing protein n=1 Tax=uncultured Draconibacterium sp. TaxID=1573823 RepID=UPI002634D83B|nr:carboxypeptidase-like regulatory domain-containing protein [uncultured Draconibacterium sp.]